MMLQMFLGLILVQLHSQEKAYADHAVLISSFSEKEKVFKIEEDGDATLVSSNAVQISNTLPKSNPQSAVPEKLIENLRARYFDCGVPIKSNVSLSEWNPKLAFKSIGDSGLFFVEELTGSESKVLGIVGQDKQSLIIPPCPASVLKGAFSPNGSIVALLSEELSGFDSGGRVRTGVSLIYLFKSLRTNKNAEIIRLKRQVLDMAVERDGRLLVLAQSTSRFTLNPLNWLLFLSGHPKQWGTVTLGVYDSSGRQIREQTLASNILNGHAQFFDPEVPLSK